MSSAHRPTWDPAAGRADNRHVSKNFSARQMPAHTKLKFRAPTQGLVPDLVARDNDAAARRDLKRELEEAERKSRNKRRKEAGLEPEEEEQVEEQGAAQESERRRLIEAAAGLDRDPDDEEAEAKDKGKGKAAAQDASDDSGSDSDSDSDSDDDEDDTAALLRELEKIKAERAEEKARAEKERAETEQSQREDDIALGNPLLNLENAMKGSSAAAAASGGGLEFGVKRRWDEDVIFKNQAQGNEGGAKGGFVNDLTRSDFHRALLRRFIR